MVLIVSEELVYSLLSLDFYTLSAVKWFETKQGLAWVDNGDRF